MPLNLMMLVDNPKAAIEAEKAGVNRVFFDLEVINKRERQRGRNTVISTNSIEDVKSIKEVLTTSELLVRINPMHANTEYEVNKVLADGADIIMLPMIVDTEDVKTFIELVDGRAKTVLLLETGQALARLTDIVNINGIDEIFIGLNDLHISLELDFMFELLSGGIVEYMTQVIKEKNIPYGFGGIARIGEGDLPAEYILGEHYRLGSSSVILSRTFKKAISNKNSLAKEIKRVRDVERNISSWEDEEYMYNSRRVKHGVRNIVNKMREQSNFKK
ncbi:MAG TPA: aldolase/citrate lyase family protein [Bacillota bacterium]